jgi:hypothetical protein
LNLKELFLAYQDFFQNGDQTGETTVAIIDEERGHYLLHTVGWVGKKRVLSTHLYVRVVDNKIWVEVDWLENGITPDLLAAGVPREDIVLAFHHPDLRPLTEFAVG